MMSPHMLLEICCEHHLCDSGAADCYYLLVFGQAFGREDSLLTPK